MDRGAWWAIVHGIAESQTRTHRHYHPTKIENILLTIILNFGGGDCAGSLLLRRLFSCCDERGLLSRCGAQASHCGAFSVEHGLLGAPASVVGAHRLQSCGAWA